MAATATADGQQLQETTSTATSKNALSTLDAAPAVCSSSTTTDRVAAAEPLQDAACCTTTTLSGASAATATQQHDATAGPSSPPRPAAGKQSAPGSPLRADAKPFLMSPPRAAVTSSQQQSSDKLLHAIAEVVAALSCPDVADTAPAAASSESAGQQTESTTAAAPSGRSAHSMRRAPAAMQTSTQQPAQGSSVASTCASSSSEAAAPAQPAPVSTSASSSCAATERHAVAVVLEAPALPRVSCTAGALPAHTAAPCKPSGAGGLSVAEGPSTPDSTAAASKASAGRSPAPNNNSSGSGSGHSHHHRHHQHRHNSNPHHGPAYAHTYCFKCGSQPGQLHAKGCVTPHLKARSALARAVGSRLGPHRQPARKQPHNPPGSGSNVGAEGWGAGCKQTHLQAAAAAVAAATAAAAAYMSSAQLQPFVFMPGGMVLPQFAPAAGALSLPFSPYVPPQYQHQQHQSQLQPQQQVAVAPMPQRHQQQFAAWVPQLEFPAAAPLPAPLHPPGLRPPPGMQLAEPPAGQSAPSGSSSSSSSSVATVLQPVMAVSVSDSNYQQQQYQHQHRAMTTQYVEAGSPQSSVAASSTAASAAPAAVVATCAETGQYCELVPVPGGWVAVTHAQPPQQSQQSQHMQPLPHTTSTAISTSQQAQASDGQQHYQPHHQQQQQSLLPCSQQQKLQELEPQLVQMQQQWQQARAQHEEQQKQNQLDLQQRLLVATSGDLAGSSLAGAHDLILAAPAAPDAAQSYVAVAGSNHSSTSSPSGSPKSQASTASVSHSPWASSTPMAGNGMQELIQLAADPRYMQLQALLLQQLQQQQQARLQAGASGEVTYFAATVAAAGGEASSTPSSPTTPDVLHHHHSPEYACGTACQAGSSVAGPPESDQPPAVVCPSAGSSSSSDEAAAASTVASAHGRCGVTQAHYARPVDPALARVHTSSACTASQQEPASATPHSATHPARSSISSEVSDESSPSTSSSHQGVSCGRCGQPGHFTEQCRRLCTDCGMWQGHALGCPCLFCVTCGKYGHTYEDCALVQIVGQHALAGCHPRAASSAAAAANTDTVTTVSAAAAAAAGGSCSPASPSASAGEAVVVHGAGSGCAHVAPSHSAPPSDAASAAKQPRGIAADTLAAINAYAQQLPLLMDSTAEAILSIGGEGIHTHSSSTCGMPSAAAAYDTADVSGSKVSSSSGSRTGHMRNQRQHYSREWQHGSGSSKRVEFDRLLRAAAAEFAVNRASCSDTAQAVSEVANPRAAPTAAGPPDTAALPEGAAAAAVTCVHTEPETPTQASNCSIPCNRQPADADVVVAVGGSCVQASGLVGAATHLHSSSIGSTSTVSLEAAPPPVLLADASQAVEAHEADQPTEGGSVAWVSASAPRSATCAAASSASSSSKGVAFAGSGGLYDVPVLQEECVGDGVAAAAAVPPRPQAPAAVEGGNSCGGSLSAAACGVTAQANAAAAAPTTAHSEVTSGSSAAGLSRPTKASRAPSSATSSGSSSCSSRRSERHGRHTPHISASQFWAAARPVMDLLYRHCPAFAVHLMQHPVALSCVMQLEQPQLLKILSEPQPVEVLELYCSAFSRQ